MKDKHSTLSYECKKCDFKNSKLSSFDRHIKTKHAGSKYFRTENSEKCSVCKIVPKTKAAFQIHQFMKHKEGDFEDPMATKKKKVTMKYRCENCRFKTNEKK